jgi:hypothetical protein
MSAEPSSTPADSPKSAQDIGKDLSACYLSSSMFTVGGVVMGSVAAARKKNIRYLAVGAFFGTTFDAVYGFTYLCKGLQNDYQRARNAAYLKSKEEEQKIIAAKMEAIDKKSSR